MLKSITVAGIGAGGSALLFLASKKHVLDKRICDFDIVEEHNLKSQLYNEFLYIGKQKVEAMDRMVPVHTKFNGKIEDADKIYLSSDWIHLGFDNMESRIWTCENISDSVQVVTDIRMRNTFVECYLIPVQYIGEYIEQMKEETIRMADEIPGERCTTRSGFYVAAYASAILIQMMERFIEGFNERQHYVDDLKLMAEGL